MSTQITIETINGRTFTVIRDGKHLKFMVNDLTKFQPSFDQERDKALAAQAAATAESD